MNTKRSRVNKIIEFAPEAVRASFSMIDATERAVIGAVFHRTDLYPALSNIIQAADFYTLSYGYIWWAFEQVYPAIDQITVANALRGHEMGRDDVIAYITGFVMDAPDINHAEHYAQMVREEAMIRRVFAATDDMRNALIQRDKTLDARLDTCNQLLFEASEQTTEADSSIKTLVSQVWDEYEQNIPVKGVPTNFRNFDAIFKQLYPGEVALLAGHPGMGKTAMLLSLVRRVVKGGLRVALFTMEQTKNEVVKILVGMESGISRTSLLEAKLTDYERQQFVQASSSMYTWDLEIVDDFAALTPTQLRRKLRLLSRQSPVDLVVLDGLWLMQLDEPTDARHRDVHTITTELVNIAKREFCLPIVISHQYNQDAKTREDRRPVIGDIADGTAAQRNLQLILAMHRDNYYDKDSTNDLTRLFCLKDRLRGNQGKVLDFRYEQGRFEEA